MKLRVTEFATSLKQAEAGEYQAYLLAWSGRIDPDGNIEPIFQTKGAFNYGKYSSQEVDDAIVKERDASDQATRKQILQQIQKTINDDAAYVFTYFPPASFAAVSAVQGFQVTPDGLMRFKATWKA
jgi:peptide/nickel transport system substrate-binding protein